MLADDFRELFDRVVVLARAEGLGRASGVRVDTRLAMVFDLHGDAISRVRTYVDHSAVLRAAGTTD